MRFGSVNVPGISGSELSTKQDKLTGTPGQVVGFSADGSAAAVRGWSNRNLLDNGHFLDPINQRGKTEYTKGYTIDRWSMANAISTSGSLKITDTGLKISHADDGGYVDFRQKFEKPITGIVTFSLLMSNNHFLSGTAEAGKLSSLSTPINGVSFYMSSNTNITIRVFPNNDGTLIAAKLELGSQQTLAHKDASGNWALNDPPPNKALELLKCQRYYQTGRYAGTARNNGHFNIQFPV